MPFTCKSCSSSPAQRCHGSWEPDKPPTHRAAAEVKVPGGMMEMRTEGVLKLFFPSFKALRFQTSFLFAQYKQTALAFPAKPPVTQPLAGHQCPCPPPPHSGSALPAPPSPSPAVSEPVSAILLLEQVRPLQPSPASQEMGLGVSPDCAPPGHPPAGTWESSLDKLSSQQKLIIKALLRSLASFNTTIIFFFFCK